MRRIHSTTAFLLSCSVFLLSVCVFMPQFHNLDAHLNSGNAEFVAVVSGTHHHASHPSVPLFDSHDVRLNKIGECLACHTLAQFHFLPSSVYFLHDCIKKKLEFSPRYNKISPHYYLLPDLRAPPQSSIQS